MSVMSKAELPIVFSDGSKHPPLADYGAPAAAYHANKNSVNQGALKNMLRSPAHFLYEWENGGHKETPIMRLGTILHALLLEPTVAATFVVKPEYQHDGRTKEGKAERKEFESSLPADAFILSADEKSTAEAMAMSLLGNEKFRTLLSNAKKETNIFWSDSFTGVSCRARLDLMAEPLGVVGDLKTCEDASAAEASRNIENNDYIIQAAHYLEAANALAGKQVFTEFVFCYVERNPPYACKLYALNPRALARGRALRDNALMKLRQCIETNSFPAYGDDISEIDLPPWAYRQSDVTGF